MQNLVSLGHEDSAHPRWMESEHTPIPGACLVVKIGSARFELTSKWIWDNSKQSKKNNNSTLDEISGTITEILVFHTIKLRTVLLLSKYNVFAKVNVMKACWSKQNSEEKTSWYAIQWDTG